MRILICFLIFTSLGCSAPEVKKNKKYTVVSTFNEVMLETEDKAEAYEAAHNLTLFGRVFSSKPCYFVLEK
jgi:hypothetical protein